MKLSKLGRALEWMHDHSKLFSGVMLVAMALLVIANFVFPAGYDRFFWESLPGAGAIYGLFSCFVIVVVSKFLGYKFLYRPEDYYDNESRSNELTGDPVQREANDE
jgi:Na+(H+)/acetate symporter ActP